MSHTTDHADDEHDGTPSDAADLTSIETDDLSPDDWPVEDLESAYRRALEANEAVEWEFEQLPTPTNEDPTSNTANRQADGASSNTSPEVDATSSAQDLVEAALPQRITARQVVEAAVFVGGEPLTTKKLCYMFRGDYELDFIEDTIEDLNRQYLDEGRPYEIRLGEGGYRMVLHAEFERVRNRVFGIGPREVKLSQEVLEVLALVAYRQPITQAEMERLGKSNPGALLRQLLRRELIAIERDPEDRKQVKYVTTKRFLSLFGLGKLEELPQADELSFK